MKTLIAAVLISCLTILVCCKNKQADTSSNTNETSNYPEVTITELDDASFAKVAGMPSEDGQSWVFTGDSPVLIDFYATWCGPCKQMAPNVQLIANKYAGKLTVYKADVEKASKTAGMLQINSIPTLVFVNPKAKQISGFSGYQDYKDLEQLVKEKFGF